MTVRSTVWQQNKGKNGKKLRAHHTTMATCVIDTDVTCESTIEYMKTRAQAVDGLLVSRTYDVIFGYNVMYPLFISAVEISCHEAVTSTSYNTAVQGYIGVPL